MDLQGTSKVPGKRKDGQREISIHRGRPEAGDIYCDNSISTGKYHPWSLLPKNLFEQFHRVANIWFLIVSICQLLPLQLSPTSSWATIAPLSMVLTVTLVKDAYLDYRRHRSDREVNNRLANVWNEDKGEFQALPWKALRVGHILIVTNNDPVPADVMLLATSEADNLCYIETSNLDGESNLKIKSALSETASIFEGAPLPECMKRLSKFDESSLQTEQPNNRLYVFEGLLKLKGHPRSLAVDNQAILLRGSVLKNTKWTIGLVVFTGQESKLVMNSKAPRLKRSGVEKRVNRYLVIVFFVLIFTSFLSAAVSVAFSMSSPSSIEYFSGVQSSQAALNFITFLILYNGLVPISLYVSMDIVRVLQSWFIQWDLRLYFEAIDRPAVVKCGDLNEDLGQIEYIFSDKTGTLTENQMEFKRCYVEGRVYGSLLPKGDTSTGQVCEATHEKFRFHDSSLYSDLKSEQRRTLREFMELLALCHTVIPSKTDSGGILYQSASPDEEALVIAAHCFGYSFVSSRSDYYSLLIHGEKRTYRLLGINDFTSDRKRMSIVLQPLDRPGSGAILYCKGADNVLFPLCDIEESEKDQCRKQLTDFAREGLRTLLVAKRVLTDSESEEFQRKFLTAKNAMYERSQRLTEVAEEFEQHLTLLGVTAIEDKIQAGVPETIAKLKEGQVKVWVLTGDKQETAVNIGYACKLLTKDMSVVTLNSESVEEAMQMLRMHLSRSLTAKEPLDLASVHRTPNPFPGSPSSMSPNTHHLLLGHTSEDHYVLKADSLDIGLVVDGATLALIFSDPQCMKYFTMLSLLCQAVICCRVSPIQKAQVVRLVKERLVFKPVTLAIGDGANDVSMIQEAHVGVGMIGNEGMQAVNSSDYAIGRFRFLLPLLFLHGRWNYQRITRVVLYSFYKNFLLVLPLFLYSFWNLYSGTALYDSWLLMSYNVALTALPIMVLGVLDQDLSADTVLSWPQLYPDGIYAKRFNAGIFVKWVCMAIGQSLVVFFLAVYPNEKMVSREGRGTSLDLVGTAAFYAVVQTATWVIFLEMRSWSGIFLLVTLISLFLFYPAVFLYDYTAFPTANLMGVGPNLFQYVPILLQMLLTPLIAVVLNLSQQHYRAIFSPHPDDHFLQLEKGLQSSAEVRNYQMTDRSSALTRAKAYSNDLSKAFKGSKVKLTPEEAVLQADFTYNRWTLVFNNPHIEKLFKRFITSRSLPFLRKMFWLVSGFNLLWTVIDLTLNDRATAQISLRVVLALVLFAVVVLAHTRLFARYFELGVLVLVVGGLAAKTGSELVVQNDGSMSAALAPIIIFVLFNISTYKLAFINAFFMVISVIRVAIKYALTYSGVDLAIIVLNYTALLFGILCVCCFVGFKVEQYKRKEYSLRKRLESEYQRGQDILSNLLPAFVKEKVRQGVRYLAQDQGVVTIMFCDIYNFDKICVSHEPRELMEMLDGYFFLLDKLCDVHGVSKIETVNKTYMACGGLKDSEASLSPKLLAKNHATRIVNLALDILKRIEPICLKTGEKFQVKIGINTGPVVAGVVGEHKPQFSLVGATVNLASRMCSTTKRPDLCQISWNTYELVKEEIGLTFEMDKVTAKGYGEVTTYYVESVFTEQTRKSVRKGTVLNRALIRTLEQQQPASPDELLNSSNMNLLDPATKRSQVAPLSHQPTSLVTEDTAHEASQEDAEDLGLVGPVLWLMCSLRETPEQQEYRISYIERDMMAMRYGLWMTACIYALVNGIFVVAVAVTGQAHGSYLFIFLRGLCSFSQLLMSFLVNKLYKSFSFPWIVTTLYTSSSLISVLTLYSIDAKFLYVIVLEIMYTNVVVNHISGLPFGFIVIASVCILVEYMMVVLAVLTEKENIIETAAFLVLFMLLNGAASYMREKQDRTTYNLNRMSLREITNTERLLNQMMPSHAVRNLKQGLTPTERYAGVTILFADIVGFTEWSKDKTPKQIIRMLSKLFSNFDHLCVDNNVYKVHTIGDCYVILGFSGHKDEGQRDEVAECTAMVNMGLSMIKAINTINRAKKTDLNMRIGLHTGSITAGITGINVVRYDIYGPDVDIANRMESSGFKGKLHVSEETKNLLEIGCPGRFNFEFDKEVVYQPMNRTITTYFVNAVKASDLE